MMRALFEMPLPAALVTEMRGRAGCRVYYLRNNTPCSRRHVIPANPRTHAQQNGRTRFADAVKRWQALDDAARKRWNGRAKGADMSGYNLFISTMMRRRRAASVMLRAGFDGKKRRRMPVLIVERSQCTSIYSHISQSAGSG